jgi:hypothetical protein
MQTVPSPAVSAADRPLRPPNVTAEFAELLEQAAAERGLAPEPWPLQAAQCRHYFAKEGGRWACTMCGANG